MYGMISPGQVSNSPTFRHTLNSEPTIEIQTGTATGYNAGNYREAVETSMDPLLLPWGPIKAQTYFAAGHTTRPGVVVRML